MGNGAGGASATFGGQTADLQNFDLKNIRTLDYNQKLANGNSGSGLTVAWASGGVQSVVLTSPTPTLTLTAPVGISKLTLFVIQDTTGAAGATGAPGGRIPTFSPVPKWTGAAPPTFSTGVNAVDIVSFLWDGTNYYGVMSPNFA
jgi:hypothetical protein